MCPHTLTLVGGGGSSSDISNSSSTGSVLEMLIQRLPTCVNKELIDEVHNNIIYKLQPCNLHTIHFEQLVHLQGKREILMCLLSKCEQSKCWKRSDALRTNRTHSWLTNFLMMLYHLAIKANATWDDLIL